MTDLAGKLERAQQAQQRAGREVATSVDGIARRLREAEAQFAAALPASIPASQFVRILVTEVRKRPELAECDPTSLLGAAMLCAQHGLSPGPLGHVYLVPRRSGRRGTRDVEFQLGYRGMIELANRSGVAVEGRAVREGDEFDAQLGTGGYVRHRPAWDALTLGQSFAWWAIGTHVDGREWRAVLSRAEVEHYRSKSQTPNAGAWQTDYDAMALKTVVRRLATFLPMTPTAAAAVAVDGATAQFEPETRELAVAYPHSDDALDVGEVELPADEVAEPEPEPEPEGAAS